MRAELELAFGNCQYPHKCICDECNSFQLVTEPILYLLDEGGSSEHPVQIVQQEQDFQLTVNNFMQKEICLTKLDKCLIANEISKCECLLFDTSKLFFVEIKSSSTGGRGKRRKKAIEQLGNTVRLLREKNINIGAFDAKAIICFKNVEPRITNSAANTAKVIFNQEFGIELEERNYIDF